MGLLKAQPAALLLCASALLVSGHGNEHASEDMAMNMGGPLHNTSTTTSGKPDFRQLYNEPSYFRLEAFSGWMLGHVVFMVLAWFFVLPLGE